MDIDNNRITIITIPKPFDGCAAISQRNAISSWQSLQPMPDIILFGDDKGVADIASEFGITHVAKIDKNDCGTPLINDVFSKARTLSKTESIAFVNTDIILFQDFIDSIAIVKDQVSQDYIIIGQRWDIAFNGHLSTQETGWQNQFLEYAHKHARLHAPTGKDYFVFNVFSDALRSMPPFAIGRGHFDNWIVFDALLNEIMVIDATDSITAIHQDHDYDHIQGESSSLLERPECLTNRLLAGYGAWHGHISDAIWKLTSSGLVRNRSFENLSEAVNIVTSLLLSNQIPQAMILAAQIADQYPSIKPLLQYKIKMFQHSREVSLYPQFANTIKSSAIKLYAGDIPDMPEYNGWTGLSLTQANSRCIQHDITQPLPFPDNSVDAFQAEDVFEHIQYDRLVSVVNEIYRVLKPGGLFRLSVPDYGCDLLRERSIKTCSGEIIFDPGGGGTPENPGHLWFPRVNSVYCLLEKTQFQTHGKMDFLHYWNVDDQTFVTRPIDYSKGHIKRTPDFDDRVKAPYRPMSIVVDLYKSNEVARQISNGDKSEQYNHHLSLSKTEQLVEWYHEHRDFVLFRERMQGICEVDFMNADLKLIQDLCMCNFIRKNIRRGAKILEIGGGNSRLLTFFKDYAEGWNLDKFEGVGNGPIGAVKSNDYKLVQNYIGNFDEGLPEQYFDLVFSVSVLEHINDEDAVLSKIICEIDRLLKPGGYSAHCIDCRFPPNQHQSIDNRRLAKYIIQQYGFDPQLVIDESNKPYVFYMSDVAYDRFWKKACNNRSHNIEGLPFNIFLVKRKI